jgi:glycosyltransferase involved in cell wall biosynthesis
MKVKIFPSDRGGCGHYRMIWPGLALGAQGYDVSVSRKMPPVVLNKKTGQIESIMPIDANIIVLQRPCKSTIVDAIRLYQKKGIKVVIDMDDDLSCIHPKNPAYRAYQTNNQHWKYANEACDIADLVTVTTMALAERYGSSGRVAIIPNFVPEKYLECVAERDELVTVGWAGYTPTHPDDLQTTHGAITAALHNQKARFLALGDSTALAKLSVRNRAPNGWKEGVSIAEYPEFIAQLDIGIVPLSSTPFNEAKSWLKALEYASVGVAPVVSPTPDNMRMVEAGAALSASDPREWISQVRSLIVDQGKREGLAAAAKEFASKKTVEANAWRWMEAWGRIVL